MGKEERMVSSTGMDAMREYRTKQDKSYTNKPDPGVTEY